MYELLIGWNPLSTLHLFTCITINLQTGQDLLQLSCHPEDVSEKKTVMSSSHLQRNKKNGQQNKLGVNPHDVILRFQLVELNRNLRCQFPSLWVF